MLEISTPKAKLLVEFKVNIFNNFALNQEKAPHGTQGCHLW